jgi:hypothetical protein
MDMDESIPEVTEALVEPFDPEAAEAQPITIPPQVIISTLRGEIASLNDQRLDLLTQVQWLSTIVRAMQEQLDRVAAHAHDGDEADHTH